MNHNGNAAKSGCTAEPPRTMKNIPREERPYEKCLLMGAEHLSDAELLAVILRTGVRGESALELSRKVLACGGGNGLLGIYHMSISDLRKIHGLGKVEAVRIRPLSRNIIWKRCVISSRRC